MNVRAIKTAVIRSGALSLNRLVDQYIAEAPERAIVVVSSKVVALCEGRVAPKAGTSKQELARREADYYLAPERNHGYALTVKAGVFVASGGVDESNGDGHYVLLPADPQASANALRQYLRRRTGRRQLGVIITDSHSVPLRIGAVGVALAHSGFAALRSYVGQPDVFGRPLRVEVANVVDGLAAAAVVAMGEGGESQPLAIIEGLPASVQFQDRDPTPEELAALHVPLAEDWYGAMWDQLPWDKRPGA